MVSVVVLAYCSNSEEKKIKCGKDKSYYNKALLIELWNGWMGYTIGIGVFLTPFQVS